MIRRQERRCEGWRQWRGVVERWRCEKEGEGASTSIGASTGGVEVLLGDEERVGSESRLREHRS